jgi:hypothetical protein
MKDEGVDLTANIHTYPNVHNKGFVIDGKTVVVSSQNFSPAGGQSRCGRDPGERGNRSILWTNFRCGLGRIARARGSRKAATGRSCEERQTACKKGEESGQKASEEVILSLC